jgi:S1-C subfamily serine protease
MANPRSNFIAAMLGGLVVLIVGAILISAGVVDAGKKTTVVQQGQTLPVSDPPGPSNGRTVADIYRSVGPGVAFVQATVTTTDNSIIPGFGPPQRGTATGSGFVLDKDGHILTNAHVVSGAKDVTVRFGKQDPVKADIVGRDPSTDIAVLKVDPSKTKLHPLKLGDSSRAQVGDAAIAIGNPFGLENTVTTGIISAIQRSINAPNGFNIDHVIQTDASINPGNSGGPLLDANGRVVGINAQIETGGSGGGSVGIGFAIPIDTAKQVVPKLEQSGHIDHPYIGITTAPITPQDAHDLNLPVSHGALVQAVSSGSPAAKAGIHAGHTQTSSGLVAGGDLVIEVAGTKINQPDDIAAAIAPKKPGDSITIRFYRGKSLKSVTLTLAQRPNKAPSQSQPGGLPFP